MGKTRKAKGSDYGDPWGFMPRGRDKHQQCYECGRMTTGRHHVIPVAHGGTKNIPLCQKCHSIVHDYPVRNPDLIREGLRKYVANGGTLGRPKVLTDNTIIQIHDLHAGGRTYRQISKLIGVSIGTVSKAVNEYTTTEKK